MASQYTPTLGNIVSSTGEKEEEYNDVTPITNLIDPRAAAEEESEDEEEMFYMNDLVNEISTMLSPPPSPPLSTPTTTNAFSPIPGPPKLVRSKCIGRTYPAIVTPIISEDEEEDDSNNYMRRYSPPTPPRQSISRELVFTSEDENEEEPIYPINQVTFNNISNVYYTDEESVYDEWDDITVPDTTTETPQLLNTQLVFYDENNNEIDHIDMVEHTQEEETEDDATWNSNSDEEDTDYDTEEENEEENNNNEDFTDTESDSSWSDGDDEPWQYSLQIDRYEEQNDRGWE